MPSQLQQIQDRLRAYQGGIVHLHAVGERNKVLEAYGVLEGVYPEVFVILVQEEAQKRRYCYAYREVLTRRVEIRLVLDMHKAIG